VNENLSAIRAAIETALNEAKSTGTGMLSGLSELRKDVGASMTGLANVGNSISPMAHMDVQNAFRSHHGMFMNHQGLLKSFGASLGLQSMAPTPEGIDPYTYKTMSREALGQRLGNTAAGGLYGGTEAALSLGGWAAGAIGGSAIAKGMGLGGFTGGVLGFGVGALAGMAVDHTLEKLGPMKRMEQKQQLSDAMRRGSWRFAGSWGEGALGGMSESQMDNVASNVHTMAKRSNFEFDQVAGMFEQGMARGLYDDVKSTSGMVSRTREIMQNVKAVSNRAHVSLESAVGVIADLKDMGFDKDPGAVMAKFDTIGIASGRTAMEVMGVARQGAEAFRGLGVSMSTGAMGAANMLGQVRSLQQAGVYSNETIRQFGGAEGMAMTQLAQSQQFVTQNPMFRGMAMSMIGTGTAGNLDLANAANSLGQSPQQMIQSAYASKEGGFAGFANKALEFQMNQGKFIDQIGAEGVQMMNEASLVKQTQYAMKILPSTMTDSLEKRQAVMFDIARKSGMAPEAATAFIQKMDRIDDVATGHGRAMAIQGRKLAAEEAVENTLLKRMGRSVSGAIEDAYDFMGGASTDTGIGRLFSKASTNLRNAFTWNEEDKIVRADFQAADKKASNMQARDVLLTKEEQKAAMGGLDEAISTAENRKKEGKFLASDVKALTSNKAKMATLMGKKTDEDVSSAVMLSMSGEGDFDAQAFVDEMGWKTSDGKGVSGDYKNLTVEQKQFMIASMEKNITKDGDPKSYQKLQTLKKSLGQDDEDIGKHLREESRLQDKVERGERKLRKLAGAAVEKGLFFDSELEDAIEDDDNGELTIKMAAYLEKGDTKTSNALRKALKDKGLNSSEIKEAMGDIRGISDANRKEFISAAKDLSKTKTKRLSERIARDVKSGPLSAEKAKKLKQDILEGKFEKAEKQLGYSNEEGVTKREVGKIAEVTKSGQNQFNADLIQQLRLMMDEIKDLRKR